MLVPLCNMGGCIKRTLPLSPFLSPEPQILQGLYPCPEGSLTTVGVSFIILSLFLTLEGQQRSLVPKMTV